MNRVARDLFLYRFGVERCYRRKVLLENPGWNWTDLLKLAVSYKMRAAEEFTFIQVGAFDGVSNDPIHGIVREFGIRGIIVEPQKDAFEMLRRNYADHPRVLLVNGAVSAVEETRDFFTVKGASEQVASFDRNHLLKSRVPAENIVCTRILCHTLAGLRRQYGFGKFDLVQIDAEGHDYEIIKTIDFGTAKPSLIRFEHIHLSERDCTECVRMLARHGYRFLSEKSDIVALAADR
jgi:FkbM family methyltransferase